MNTNLLTTLTERTYSRSDFAYQMSLVRELFEYVFFTKREAHATKDGVEDFITKTSRQVADVIFLRSLPQIFLEAFTQETFYETLEQIDTESKKLKTLTLTVPVTLARADTDAIGTWARSNIDRELMIDVDVDQALSVGCRVVWGDKLHDYGFDYYVRKNESVLEARFSKLSEQVAANP